MPQYFLSLQEQRNRYLQHRNSLSDEGYKQFLYTFLQSVFDFPNLGNFRPESILDYGSGPEPALVKLLQESAATDGGRTLFGSEVLGNASLISGWDPFFAPEHGINVTDCLRGSFNTASGGFDLVTCLEVAEHFENPRESFAGIASICTEGGYAAVGTLPIPAAFRIPEDFKSWWYKDDGTHVSFYTERAIAVCGMQAGFLYEGMAGPRIFIFRKASR